MISNNVMSHKYIPKTINLRFDPKEITDSEGRVLTRGARVLWLGLTSKILDTPKLRKKCLEFADGLRAQGIPESSENLGKRLESYGIKVKQEHLKELFPYVHEKREPNYRVLEK